MNEARNLPIVCVFLHSHYRYYVPLNSPPIRNTIRQAYTLFYLSVMGRVSPVPNHTFHTYCFLYTEGFFCAAFQFLRTFHGFSPICPAQLPFVLFSETFFLTIRQNSLNVTVCMIACTFYQGYFIHSLSTLHYSAPSLATQLTGDYRDRTYTGVVQLRWTHDAKGSAWQILSLILSVNVKRSVYLSPPYSCEYP